MPEAPPPAPLPDRYVARLKQKPVIAALLVIAAIVTGVAGFTDSAKKLVAMFQPEHAEDPRQKLLKLEQPFTQDAFVAAAARGDVTATTLYAQAGLPVDEPSAQGRTALGAATQARRAAVVKQLLAAKADQSKWGAQELPALVEAASSGDVELTQLLLDAGPPPALVKRAYVSAAANAQLATLQALAPRLSATLAQVATEALWAVAGGSRDRRVTPEARAAMAKILLTAGADAQAVDPDDQRATVLHRAAYKGQVEVARVLLDHGVPVDPRDADGATPLWWVAGVGNLEMARLLIEHRADATAAAKDGTTVLARARYNRDDAMTALLKEHGAR